VKKAEEGFGKFVAPGEDGLKLFHFPEKHSIR
jgi:hypothetical protein